MNVALIGFRGTGKTTVAKLLAGRLGWTMVDSDDDPHYGVAVDYAVKTGILGGGH